MARMSCVQFLRSRLAIAALPLFCAAFVSLSGCDKPTDQPTRRYCDQSGCYECSSSDTSRCYPVAGEPVKPEPGPVASCDNDAACGAAKVCNLGKCEAACTDDKSCASGLACISGRCRPSDSASCGTAGARCTGDVQCGTNARCVDRVCAANCNAGKCPTGQICDSGSCVEDKSPTTPQCVFDNDCNAGKGGFRCVNAYCLAVCADSSTCQNGTSCLKGICRGTR
jgi:hypothetical protein